MIHLQGLPNLNLFPLIFVPNPNFTGRCRKVILPLFSALSDFSRYKALKGNTFRLNQSISLIVAIQIRGILYKKNKRYEDWVQPKFHYRKCNRQTNRHDTILRYFIIQIIEYYFLSFQFYPNIDSLKRLTVGFWVNIALADLKVLQCLLHQLGEIIRS